LGIKQADNNIDSPSQIFMSTGCFCISFSATKPPSSWTISGELQITPGQPPPATEVVPDLFQMDAKASLLVLQAAGLVPSFANLGSWVESQKPRAGGAVAPGTTVTMYMRSGLKQ
jgi:hypothetical protein